MPDCCPKWLYHLHSQNNMYIITLFTSFSLFRHCSLALAFNIPPKLLLPTGSSMLINPWVPFQALSYLVIWFLSNIENLFLLASDCLLSVFLASNSLFSCLLHVRVLQNLVLGFFSFASIPVAFLGGGGWNLWDNCIVTCSSKNNKDSCTLCQGNVSQNYREKSQKDHDTIHGTYSDFPRFS